MQIFTDFNSSSQPKDVKGYTALDSTRPAYKVAHSPRYLEFSHPFDLGYSRF
jgi:hypothetical protein